MKKLTIFDFDGTIVDVWTRYCKVFCDFWGLKKIGLEEYRRLKYMYPKDDELVAALHLNSLKLVDYKYYKKKMLEQIYYLKFDSLLVSIDELQTYFRENDSLVITVRRNKQAYFSQIQWLGLDFIAPKTIILNPGSKDVKVNWVKQHLRGIDISVIGDSETDLAFTELNNCKVYFVETGLRSYEKMNEKWSGFETIDSIQSFFRK